MPICRFAAEPPQGGLPPEDTLKAEFLAACLKVETDPDDPDLGEAGDINWFPDRTWSGRTYVPATARTSTGLELFGYVSFSPGDEPSSSCLESRGIRSRMSIRSRSGPESLFR